MPACEKFSAHLAVTIPASRPDSRATTLEAVLHWTFWDNTIWDQDSSWWLGQRFLDPTGKKLSVLERSQDLAGMDNGLGGDILSPFSPGWLGLILVKIVGLHQWEFEMLLGMAYLLLTNYPVLPACEMPDWLEVGIVSFELVFLLLFFVVVVVIGSGISVDRLSGITGVWDDWLEVAP